MLKVIVYGIIIYFVGKWLYKWLEKTIPSDFVQTTDIEGEKKEDSDFEINPDDVEDVNFTEIDEEDDKDKSS